MTPTAPTSAPASDKTASREGSPALLLRGLRLIVRYRTLAVFIGMVILGGLLSPELLSLGNVTNVLRQASFNGLLSTGMTFVILTRGIDLSGGSILGVAAMVAGLLKDHNIVTIFVCALGVGGLLGAGNGVVIAKLRLEPFVVTLAMLTVARGVALVVSKGYLITGVQDTFREVGVGYVLGVPNPVIIMAVVFAGAWFVLRYTQFGRRVYATGANEEAARLAGVNVDGHKIAVYAISGVLAALAGLVLVARLQTADPLSGTGFELDAIAATVIGGTTFDGGKGGIGGTIIGVLILAMLNNILNLMNISPYAQQIVKGLVLLGAVVMNEYTRRR
jgi:ribose/xylose/arabinose/galactoside ABC-type transport system permease subunit